MDSSGIRPLAARFSRTWSIRRVAGMAQVTAGWLTMNFSANRGPNPAQSISAAHAGSGWRRSRRSSSPS
jgi:hypothetical protein